MKKYILVPVILIAVFISCKKSNSNNNNCAITEANLEGSYKLTDAYYTSTLFTGDVFTNPLFASEFPACQKDDITSLNANNVYVYTDAGDTCTPKGGSTGMWSLKADTLIISTGSENDSEIVSSFNCSSAVLIKNNVNQQGDQLKLTFTKQ